MFCLVTVAPSKYSTVIIDLKNAAVFVIFRLRFICFQICMSSPNSLLASLDPCCIRTCKPARFSISWFQGRDGLHGRCRADVHLLLEIEFGNNRKMGTVTLCRLLQQLFSR